MAISRSSMPWMFTLETSFMFSISSSRYSAYFFSSSMEKSPERFILIMGNSEKSISDTSGSVSKSLGSSLFALSTASLVSCNALLISTLVLNSTIIIDASCNEVDVSFFSPLTFSNSFSSGLEIRFSISIGGFPG